jgi:hypothetical protein
VTQVVGLAMRIPGPQPAGAPPRAIRATYRVTPARPGTRVRVLKVTGPFLRGADVRVSGRARNTAADQSGSEVVTVSGVADCRSLSALDAGGARYPVTVRTTGLDGTAARGRPGVPPSLVDWAAAVRQDCWQRVAAAGVKVTGLVATPHRAGRDVLLDVRLTSSLERDVEVAAVDVADVSTIEPADSGTLPAGGSRVVRVRLPLPECSLGLRPAVGELLWSVGEVGEDAAATFVTALPSTADAAVLVATQESCSPPGTTITVTDARVLAPNAVLSDPHGAAIALRLRLRSGSPLVVLGREPGPTTTSDARVPTGVARVHPVAGPAQARIVWQASCSAAPPIPLSLPVRLPGPGADRDYAVTVDDPVVARTYARACGLRLDALVAAGWRGRGT